jgi:pyocin large subunit-like protein
MEPSIGQAQGNLGWIKFRQAYDATINLLTMPHANLTPDSRKQPKKPEGNEQRDRRKDTASAVSSAKIFQDTACG